MLPLRWDVQAAAGILSAPTTAAARPSTVEAIASTAHAAACRPLVSLLLVVLLL